MRAPTRTFAFLALALVAASVGCVGFNAPRESSRGASGSPPTITALRNDAWQVTPDGNETFKIVVLDVTSHGDLRLAWHDLLLNTSGAPLSPSSAFIHPPHNYTYALTQDHVMRDNETVRIELHYHSVDVPRVDHGTFDYVAPDGTARPIDFTLPPESPR